MRNILLVYYSRTGTTSEVANAIGTICDAEIERIRDIKSRDGLLGYMRSGREVIWKRQAAIEPTSKDPAQYDLVILGTPVWAQNIASPMRTYVDQNRERIKQVALFCCQGGAGADKAFKNIETLLGRRAIATMTFYERDVKADQYQSKVNEFSQAIKQFNEASEAA